MEKVNYKGRYTFNRSKVMKLANELNQLGGVYGDWSLCQKTAWRIHKMKVFETADGGCYLEYFKNDNSLRSAFSDKNKKESYVPKTLTGVPAKKDYTKAVKYFDVEKNSFRQFYADRLSKVLPLWAVK